MILHTRAYKKSFYGLYQLKYLIYITRITPSSIPSS
jgi:hypothetical protein